MTLFGRTLGPEEIFALVGLLTALVLWLMAWRGERDWAIWFRAWEADRRARREAQALEDQPPSERGGPGGPWG